MKKLLVSLTIIFIPAFTVTGCGVKSKQPVSKVKEIHPIPHKVDSTMVCAECHKDGKNGAKITKHLDRPNCTQCHKQGK